MNLSKRLMEVAGLVTCGNSVADIGTDHGYIPIYLAVNGISPKVIAMDVNEGPLGRACENIEKYRVSHIVETRLSDGLNGLEPAEVQTAIIAGMGGLLTIRILSDNMDIVGTLKELILSPHSDVEQVRRFLADKGMKTVDERIVKDDGKFYFIIKAVPCAEKQHSLTDCDAGFGRLLLDRKDPVLREYLENQLRKKKIILERLMGQAVTGISRIDDIKNDIAIIEKGLDMYEG